MISPFAPLRTNSYIINLVLSDDRKTNKQKWLSKNYLLRREISEYCVCDWAHSVEEGALVAVDVDGGTGPPPIDRGEAKNLMEWTATLTTTDGKDKLFANRTSKYKDKKISSHEKYDLVSL